MAGTRALSHARPGLTEAPGGSMDMAASLSNPGRPMTRVRRRPSGDGIGIGIGIGAGHWGGWF